MESKLLSDVYRAFILSGRDTRYQPDGYGFVLASLDFVREKRSLTGHIEASDIIDGVIELSLMKFGPLAEQVLKKWGIVETIDIGTIVYNLISMEILSRTSDDKLSNFETDKSVKTLLKSTKIHKINKKKIKILKDS